MKEAIKIAAIVIVVVIVVGVSVGVFFLTKAPAKPPEEAPTRIKLGHSDSFTGVCATAAAICDTFTKLWTEEINARGGIYVEDYGKKIPVTWVFYNDKGKTGIAIKNTEKLITGDKVPLLWGSYGTYQGNAARPIVNKYVDEYGTIYIGGNQNPIVWDSAEEFMSYYEEDKIVRNEEGEPWWEWNRVIWNMKPAYWLMEALVEVMQKVGVEDCVVWEIGTLYGVEHGRMFMHHVKRTDIEVLSHLEYPMDIKDFSPLVTEAKELKPDAVIQLSYPSDAYMAMEDMMEMDFNPKLYYNALGVTAGQARKRFGANLDGIMYHGTAFPMSPVSKAPLFGTGEDLMYEYAERYGFGADAADGPWAYGVFQIMRELIERSGSLDPDDMWEELLKTPENPIPTVSGGLSWRRGPWGTAPKNIAQLIGTEDDSIGEDIESVGVAFGEAEGIRPEEYTYDESDWVTHEPLYPKPEWKD